MTEDTTKITLLETPVLVSVPVPLPNEITQSLAPETTDMIKNASSTTITTTPHIIQQPIILSEPCVIQADPSISSFPIIHLGLSDTQNLQIDVSAVYSDSGNLCHKWLMTGTHMPLQIYRHNMSHLWHKWLKFLLVQIRLAS